MKKLKCKKGFTLVELIIIIGLAGIVLVPLTMLVTSSLRNANRTQRVIDSMQDAQRIFIVMNESFRGSTSSDIEFIETSMDSDIPNNSFRIKTKTYFSRSDGFYYKDSVTTEVIKLSDYVISHTYTFEGVTFLTSGWIKLSIEVEPDKGSGRTKFYETTFYIRQ